jgi:hypothetical protein
MDFVIISKNISKEEAIIESKLLWASVLFSNNVHHASLLAIKTNIEFILPIMTERQKIDVYKHYFGQWNNKITPEVIEENYQLILKTRKVKRKIKEELIVLLRGENFIEYLRKAVLESTRLMIDEFKINGIKNFYDRGNKNVIKLWDLAEFDFSGINLNTYIEAVYTTLDNSYEIPIFDESVEKYFSNKEKGGNSANPQGYISLPLFTFPAPESLTESQVKIIRNELKDKLNLYFGIIERLKQEVREILFSENLPADIPSLTELKEASLDIQKAIGKNIFFEKINTLNADRSGFTLYMGLTSFENVVCVYKYKNVLSSEQELYVKEKMRGLVNLSNTTPFLYLKVISG